MESSTQTRSPQGQSVTMPSQDHRSMADARVPGLTASQSTIQPAADDSAFILCCYQNHSSAVQIIRSTSFKIADWHLEKVVFPGQRLMFHAPQRTKIKVYTSNIAGNLLMDTVPCDRIQVTED